MWSYVNAPLINWAPLYSTLLGAKPQTAAHIISLTTTGATRPGYSRPGESEGPDSSNVASQQFELSKDTFRWTLERAKINFNRLKILIFPVNNQETFPVGGRANRRLWEEVRLVERGIWCGSQSTTLLSAALFTFRSNGGKAQAQSPVSLRKQTFGSKSFPLKRARHRVVSNFYDNNPEWSKSDARKQTDKSNGKRPRRGDQWSEVTLTGSGTMWWWRRRIERRRKHLLQTGGGGFSFPCCRGPGETSGWSGLARPKGICIIHEPRRILRLNICWFVKSKNMRSCPSPWHISSGNRKTLSHI